VGLLLRWFLNAIALYLTVAAGHALGLGLGLHNAGSALIAVLVLAIVNALIGTIIRLMTMPINCLTLGLFSIIINALLFWLVGNIQQSGLIV
jgi:putative membrane protein